MCDYSGVLVTGASGFLGSRLLCRLSSHSVFRPTGAVRTCSAESEAGLVAVGDINRNTDWSLVLQGQSVVVHTAGRVHIMSDQATDPLLVFREVNVLGTLNLARQAAETGVRRFVFISSIKVNGEHTDRGSCFKEGDFPAPQDPYSVSKLEAERGLQQIALETGMEVVIIRPPLVYGPGVKGNFANMIKLVEKGLPLPFGAIHNRRSLVSLDNLVDFIITCIGHPNAANHVFLVSDGADLSTTELFRRVAKMMGKPSRLIPVPAGFLQLATTLLGKKAVGQRLLGSLQVDISKARNLLTWTPPVPVNEGLRRCFLSESER